MHEFMAAQNRTMKTLARQVCEDWPSSVTMTVKNGLISVGKGHFDVDMTKTDMYKFSKLRKLLSRINYLMEDSLRIMTRKSLEAWQKFVIKASAGRIEHGILPKDTDTFYASKGCSNVQEKLALLAQGQPVFKVVVVPSKEKVVLNTEDVISGDKAIADWYEEQAEVIKKAKKDGKPLPGEFCVFFCFFFLYFFLFCIFFINFLCFDLYSKKKKKFI